MTPEEEYGSSSTNDSILSRPSLNVWETVSGILVTCNTVTCNNTPPARDWRVTFARCTWRGTTLGYALEGLGKHPKCTEAIRAFQVVRHARSKVARLYDAQCYFLDNQPVRTDQWGHEWVTAGDVYVAFSCKGPVDVWQVVVAGHTVVSDTLETAIATLKVRLALDTANLSALLKPEGQI